MGASPAIAPASTQEKLDLAKDLGAEVIWITPKRIGPNGCVRLPTVTGLTTSWRWSAGTFHKNLRCPNALGCAVVFGVASGDRGSLVPAELIKTTTPLVGFIYPAAWPGVSSSSRA